MLEKEIAKVAEVADKVCQTVCCGIQCQELCDRCWGSTDVPLRIDKADIQPIVVEHQPAARQDSATSQLSLASMSVTSSFSTQYSPSIRERVDSEASSWRSSTASTPDYKQRATPTPIIDMKPIEFWAANRETIQPRTPRRRLPSESEISVDDFQPDLYASTDSAEEALNDEEKLARFKLGQVHISIQYEIPFESLMVRIIEARDLPLPYCQHASKQDMAHSNPYAKVSLLPDQKSSFQTSVERKTQHPEWNESFHFELPFKEAQRRTLEVTIKDFDKYSRHCVIGQVHLALDTVNLLKGGHMWKPLSPSTVVNPDLGEVLLSLNYLPSAGRLNVDMIKGKQLQQMDLIGGSDPYIKLSLFYNAKTAKHRKTSVKKNTIDPVFNESFSFNVSAEQLSECSLVVTVWDHDSKSKDNFVGRIVMGRYASSPYEVTHWNRMLQCQRSPIAQWHTLLPRAECDAQFPASSTLT